MEDESFAAAAAAAAASECEDAEVDSDSAAMGRSRCRVPYCRTAFVAVRDRQPGRQYPSVFAFPRQGRDQARLRAWLEFCCLRDLREARSFDGVCQEHFDPDDVVLPGPGGSQGGRKRLRAGAVPTLNEPTKAQKFIVRRVRDKYWKKMKRQGNSEQGEDGEVEVIPQTEDDESCDEEGPEQTQLLISKLQPIVKGEVAFSYEIISR